MWKLENITLTIGIAVFSFQNVGIAMNIRGSMEKPRNFQRIFTLSTCVTCVFYLVFGIVTQLALGEYVANIVLLNFAP